MQYLGKVEGVKLEPLGLLEGHDLDEEGPGRVVAVGDGVEQISDGVVGVGGGKTVGLLHRQVLDALVRLRGTNKKPGDGAAPSSREVGGGGGLGLH